jgi:ceramide glucosyltransferase
VISHVLALAVKIVTTALAVAGMGYFFASLLAARRFLREWRAQRPEFAPGVSILKALKGIDPGMIEAFRSHCRQSYAGEFELLFGVATLDDPAAAAVKKLQSEFPELAIRLVECPQRLGSNGKVSTLVQLAAQVRYDYLLVNDSDITVSPQYLRQVMACFAPAEISSGAEARTLQGEFLPSPVGLVTALYRGRAHGSLASRFEALGIATDFQAGVLMSKWIEGGLSYGLGSTLAVRREALEKAGGLIGLVDHLADDYEMGARVARAGYRVELCAEVVETSVPAYGWRGFFDHQLRWLRAVRVSRPAGYVGLIFTYGLGWALVNALACGFSRTSLWLLGASILLRLAQAATVGGAVVGDRQAMANLWLLPARDLVAFGLWIAGFVGNTIVWRGERFVLKGGRLVKV